MVTAKAGLPNKKPALPAERCAGRLESCAAEGVQTRSPRETTVGLFDRRARRGDEPGHYQESEGQESGCDDHLGLLRLSFGTLRPV